MERDYHNEDFDYFLRQKADQYKLYPSDKVWKGIYGYLHPRKRWYTIGGGLLLLTGLFFVSQYFISSGPAIKAPADVTFLAVSRPGTIQSTIEPASPSSNSNPAAGKPVIPNHNTAAPNSLTSNPIIKNLLPTSGKETSGKNGSGISFSPSDEVVTNVNDILESDSHSALKPSVVYASGGRPAATINTTLPLKTELSIHVFDATKAAEPSMPEIETIERIKAIGPDHINWLAELAAIKLTPRKKGPFNLQFYFSPTITYRRLSDNKDGLPLNQQNIPMTTNAVNIDRYVDHKPSFGAELGSNILFNASRSLVLKTGIQLNYSRYNIKAYKFYFEKASIALNTSGPIADTIRAFTSIRNFNGYSPEELQNQYLQVSLPVGAELKLLGNSRLQLNIAGSIQPTYLLFNDTYLLSTDYVNYAKEASLVRKWNVNTSLEAFLSYNTGGLRWQLGPQFRYQLMSSYIDRYPIKEYLMEYSVKFGVSKTLR